MAIVILAVAFDDIVAVRTISWVTEIALASVWSGCVYAKGIAVATVKGGVVAFVDVGAEMSISMESTPTLAGIAAYYVGTVGIKAAAVRAVCTFIEI